MVLDIHYNLFLHALINLNRETGLKKTGIGKTLCSFTHINLHYIVVNKQNKVQIFKTSRACTDYHWLEEYTFRGKQGCPQGVAKKI